MTMETFYLNDVWCLYFHDPYDMNWEPNSYKFITTISSVNDFIEIYMTFNELLTKGMFFIMRDHIMPRWEDENNKNGGCFSFKINKNEVLDKLFEVTAQMLGETLGKCDNISLGAEHGPGAQRRALGVRAHRSQRWPHRGRGVCRDR